MNIILVHYLGTNTLGVVMGVVMGVNPGFKEILRPAWIMLFGGHHCKSHIIIIIDELVATVVMHATTAYKYIMMGKSNFVVAAIESASSIISWVPRDSLEVPFYL